MVSYSFPIGGSPILTVLENVPATDPDARAEIAHCMLRDQPALRHAAARLSRLDDPRARARLAGRIAESAGIRARRARCRPALTYPPELPVVEARERIRDLIAAHPVSIICGETGSGKTTQLPKICLELGRGVGALIGHTQPRRVAARAVARRIAAELGTEVGGAVGYKVRFRDETGPDTYIKLMTDGILLAEIARDRDLRAYDTLIIDEAHERSLNIDFLFGFLSRLLPRRPDLKVVITSATLDPQRISAHFDDAPVLEVSGRSYPVEVRYRPPTGDRAGGEDAGMQAAVARAVHEACREGPGDVLVFLAGEREIREVADGIRRDPRIDAELLALYARLNAAQQERVFRPRRGGRRRVVLATNVAETSLTVPGIRYVVDSGRARISRYSYRSRVQRLPVEPISRSSAEQRKGRCGRVGPGICYRLYTEEDLLGREAFTVPEIQRTNLASVILQMSAAGLGDIRRFPFIDPPDPRFITDGHRLLRDLGAIGESGRLTPVGRKLARLPVDPRIGRMILAAAERGCVTEVLVIAAVLSVGDPRSRPVDKRDAAREVQQPLTDRRSDFFTYLRIWRFYQDNARALSRGQLRRLCERHYLSPGRMREWSEVHRQLLVAAREIGLRGQGEPGTFGQVHRALLSGLLSFVGQRRERREYAGPSGSIFVLSQASAVAPRTARWVVAAELVETTSRFAHTAARVRPQWIEQVAHEQVRRTYFDIHWDPERAEVMAFERVTLRGLTLVARRRVRYEPIDPAESRRVFISSALVDGAWQSSAHFARHNACLMRQVRQLEQKLRRPDLVTDAAAIFRFYDRRLPPGVCGGRVFTAWYERAAAAQPDVLCFALEDLLRAGPRPSIARVREDYPDELEVDGHRLALSYRFDPASEADGVSVEVPVAILRQIHGAAFDWLVPGMRLEKTVALLRSLPKALRRRLVPIPDLAARLLGAVSRFDQPILDALERGARELAGVEVPREAWRPDALPRHLLLNVRLVDGGQLLACGRDFRQLKYRNGPVAGERFRAIASEIHDRRGLTSWSFGELRDRVVCERGGQRICGYPALEDDRSSVALRLYETRAQARHALRGGLRRLFMLQASKEVKQSLRSLPEIDRLCLGYALVAHPHPGAAGSAAPDACAELKRHIVEKAVDMCFGAAPETRWTQAGFEARLAAGRRGLVEASAEVCRRLSRILAAYRSVRAARQRVHAAGLEASLADADDHLRRLVYQGFLADIPAPALAELPRYLEALALRLGKLPGAAERDARMVASIRDVWARFWDGYADQPAVEAGCDEFRWMLEELRVSAFAQELGTRRPVSVRRLEDYRDARTSGS